ncbi:hypothetical protein AB6N24_17815 [Cellulomonas sp. 179-A 4D5 NHS]|uniref:hypothetical protein n=1 Tax=Cellulomonas sp. 179-A 4D5 NHS TaxID=3142378 RepID=UPI0039A0AEF5
MKGLTRRATGVALIAVALLAGFAVPSSGRLNAVSRPAVLVDRCAEAQLAVSYEVAYAPALHGYEVSRILVRGMPAQCSGREMRVTLTAFDGRELADVATRLNDTGAHVSQPFESPVLAADVAEVSAVVRD